MSSKEKTTLNFNNKLVTVIANGVEVPADAKLYPQAKVVLTDGYEDCIAWFTRRKGDPYRAALVIEKDGIVPNMSVTEAIQGGSYDDREARDIRVESHSDNFTAVLVNGGEYAVRDAQLVFDSKSDGRNVCDFNGLGAVVSAFNGAKVELENVDFFVRGVARPSVFVDSYANVLMKNCKMKVMGGELYGDYRNCCDQRQMVAPPWVLGLTGTARGINAMGDCGTLTIVDCDLAANQWGVISTDSGSDIVLTVIDSKLVTLGEGQKGDPYALRFGSGYGSYVIDDVTEFFRGVHFQVGTYAAVICGGDAVYASSKGTFDIHQHYFIPNPAKPEFINHFGKVYPGYDVGTKEEPVFSGIEGKGQKTIIESDGFGFMSHDWGSVTLLEGTEVHSKFSTFLLKAGNIRIDVDDAVLDPGDNIILQLIDNDDSAVGVFFDPPWVPDGNLRPEHIYGPFFNTEFNERPGYPGIDYDAPGTLGEEKVDATFRNVKLKGNFYNASGYASDRRGGDAQGRPLTLVFGENAELQGAIASTSVIHVNEKGEQNTHFTMKEYYHLGHVANKVHFNGVNTIDVTLEANATWVVTGPSLISSLSIGSGATVTAPQGKTLRVLLDGKVTEITSGMDLKGDIRLDVI